MATGWGPRDGDRGEGRRRRRRRGRGRSGRRGEDRVRRPPWAARRRLVERCPPAREWSGRGRAGRTIPRQASTVRDNLRWTRANSRGLGLGLEGHGSGGASSGLSGREGGSVSAVEVPDRSANAPPVCMCGWVSVSLPRPRPGGREPVATGWQEKLCIAVRLRPLTGKRTTQASCCGLAGLLAKACFLACRVLCRAVLCCLVVSQSTRSGVGLVRDDRAHCSGTSEAGLYSMIRLIPQASNGTRLPGKLSFRTDRRMR